MSYHSFFQGSNIDHVPNVTAAPPQPLGIPTDVKIGITTAYAVIFLVALFGNSFGLIVVLKKSSSANVTNVFIANMAVADLLLTSTVMPFSVAYMFRGSLWIGGTLGNITCKAVFYTIPVSIAATVFTMMFISFDRFYAIFFPLKEKFFRKPKILSATIWILSFLLMIPYVFLFQARFYPSENVHYCVQVWPWADQNDLTFEETFRVLKSFHICVFVIMYALPLFITIFVYFLICRKLWLRKIPGNITDSNRAAAEKSKRKVVRLLVVICVVFALCWFPVYVNHYFWYVRPDQAHRLPVEVQFVFSWLAHANSALNPCLYILLNEKFRKELFAILTCCPCLRRYRRRSSTTSMSIKNDSNGNSTTVWRLMSFGRSSAYTLPRSRNDKENGHTNLSLSWMSIKDDRSPPNSAIETSLNNSAVTKEDNKDDAICV